jgi:hypothetical protein
MKQEKKIKNKNIKAVKARKYYYTRPYRAPKNLSLTYQQLGLII